MLSESRRLKLQNDLEAISGIKKAYFQPPASISMEYPCVVFNFDDDWTLHANGEKYIHADKYSLTFITKEPNPEDVLTEIASWRYCSFDRHFVSDNLHHFVYTLYVTKRYERE